MTDLRDVVDVRGLTPTQEGMLYHSLSAPGSDVFHSQVATTLDADLDVEGFQDAWKILINRHEALRTAFFWDGLDQSLQVVRPDARVEWNVSDWSHLSPAAFSDSLEAELERDGFAPIDLDEAPLMRMRLIRQPDTRWTWIWTFHHLILDGWSVRVLMRELSEVYGGSGKVLNVPTSPSNYLDWLNSLDLDESRRYWTARLSEIPGPQRLEMPGFDGGGRGHDRINTEIPDSLAVALTKAATAQKVTLSVMFSAAWSLVVSAMTGSDQSVVGVTTSGRSPQLHDVENLVGMFLNTLPLITRIDSDLNVGEYLSQVHDRQLGLVEHQHLGLTEIHRLAGIQGRESLFESIVVFENLPPETTSATVSFDDLEFREHSDFPLALLVMPGDALSVRLVFDRSRFTRAAASRLLESFVVILSQLTTLDLELASLRLGSTDETELTGPEAETPTVTVVERIASMARNHPDHAALATEDDTLTYGDMWQKVESLARHYSDRGVGRGDRVGVMIPRSIDLIVAILAIMRAGAAYVPLDPGYPRRHLELLIDQARLAAIVSNNPSSAMSTQVTSLGVEASPSPESGSLDLPSVGDLAYVIHTSGSTGRPKGVAVTHGSLASSTYARETFYEDPVDSFLLLSSASFDSSVAGIFWTLTTGGCLVLPPADGERDVDQLGNLIRQRNVTHMLSLPGLYRILADEGAPISNGLRCVILAGEAVDGDTIERHFQQSSAKLFNEYGPTEATVWATASELTRGSDPRNIGSPIAGTSVRVVNHLGSPLPPGFSGELTVAGPGVVSGYLDDETATNRSFIFRDGRAWYHTGDRCAVAEDGELRFLGRIDNQLKIRGFRVEPGEIEAALRQVQGVDDAVVNAVTIGVGENLVAYVVGEANDEILRTELRRRLPAHMVPSFFVPMRELPRLANGKIDNSALPAPDLDRQRNRARATTESEQILAAIWSELLGVPEVGIDEDFFELGGDSLLAIKMVSRARRQGLQVEPSDAVANPTVRGLAHNAESNCVRRYTPFELSRRDKRGGQRHSPHLYPCREREDPPFSKPRRPPRSRSAGVCVYGRRAERARAAPRLDT